MKVTDIKTFVVDCFRTNWVFVKVYTDEGITGVGEATLEYKEKALLGAVEHIKQYHTAQRNTATKENTNQCDHLQFRRNWNRIHLRCCNNLSRNYRGCQC